VTILHPPEYLKKAREDVATMFGIPKFTCDDCPDQTTCPFVFDVYNQDGDCLAEK